MNTEKILLTIYLALFTLLAFNPYDRAVWWAENIPVILLVTLLVLTHSRFQFSKRAYGLMMMFIVLHTIGGHYTFERVPFDWVSNLFGFERNHYDRLSHFSVGFYAYPIAEFIVRKQLITNRVMVALFALFSIVTVAAFYELIEWQYAVLSAPEQGSAFLGSQGDIWDAQKDILADTLGAICVIIWFCARAYKPPPKTSPQ